MLTCQIVMQRLFKVFLSVSEELQDYFQGLLAYRKDNLTNSQELLGYFTVCLTVLLVFLPVYFVSSEEWSRSISVVKVFLRCIKVFLLLQRYSFQHVRFLLIVRIQNLRVFEELQNYFQVLLAYWQDNLTKQQVKLRIADGLLKG